MDYSGLRKEMTSLLHQPFVSDVIRRFNIVSESGLELANRLRERQIVSVQSAPPSPSFVCKPQFPLRKGQLIS